jgi:hypothetical protein
MEILTVCGAGSLARGNVKEMGDTYVGGGFLILYSLNVIRSRFIWSG